MYKYLVLLKIGVYLCSQYDTTKPNTMKDLTNKQAAIGLVIIIIICLLADNL